MCAWNAEPGVVQGNLFLSCRIKESRSGLATSYESHAGRPLETLKPGCEVGGLLPAAINGQLARSNCAFDIYPPEN